MKIIIENTTLSSKKLALVEKGIQEISNTIHEKIWVELRGVDVVIEMSKPESITELDDEFTGEMCIVDNPNKCCDELTLK